MPRAETATADRAAWYAVAKRTALIGCHAIICETMNIYPQAVPKAALSCIDELAMRPLAELYRYSRMILMTHNCNPNEIVVSLKLTIAYR